MAGINSLKGLRNVNLTSIKEGAKKTAALTLLLSMTACTQNELANASLALLCILPFAIPLLGPIIGMLFIREKKEPPAKYAWSDESDPNKGRH